MKLKEEVIEKIIFVEKKIEIIDAAISKELTKSFFMRSKSVCRFLYIEKKIYTRLHKELKWILNE